MLPAELRHKEPEAMTRTEMRQAARMLAGTAAREQREDGPRAHSPWRARAHKLARMVLLLTETDR